MNSHLSLDVLVSHSTHLQHLKNVLLVIFPVIILLLFFIARFFAGRSIRPVNSIIETSSQITQDNLQMRISLPSNKDELYILSQNINHLLDRIEHAIEREKQFTSDASHELRTPLNAINGIWRKLCGVSPCGQLVLAYAALATAT